jgi:hypothetical protein
MHVYTVAERGLQYCAWLTDDLSKVLGEQIPPAQPAKRALLFDLRSFRPAVDVHRAVLLRAISDAAALQIEELLVLVPARDSVLRLAAAQTGFSHRATLRTFTRFGRTRQHVTTHHVPLRTDNSSAAPPTSPQPTRATVNQKLFAAALTMGHCSKSIVNSFQEVPLV